MTSLVVCVCVCGNMAVVMAADIIIFLLFIGLVFSVKREEIGKHVLVFCFCCCGWVFC